MRSVTSKCSPSRRGWNRQAQPTRVRAVSYSEKAGAVSRAVRGCRARARRKITSAAPLPQKTRSGSVPSIRAMAARSSVQAGSG